MPYLPPQFRQVPMPKSITADPVHAIIDDLPLTPQPLQADKPQVPLSNKGRQPKKRTLGIERLSMRKFEKSPDEIRRILES